LAVALAATGCTTAGPHARSDGDGWETVETWQCDWKQNSTYLHPDCVPNSPIIPFTRGEPYCTGGAAPIKILLVVPFMLDIAFSPIAYFFDRNCWTVGTERNYVGTPESRHREAEAARLAREEAARRDSAQAKEERRRAEAAAQEDRRRTEAAAQLERDFPALAAPATRTASRPDDFAIVVGIQDYRRVPKADYAEEDAKAVQAQLQALGVPAANTILLTGQDASRADVTKYLEEWLPGVVKPDSHVYFYYSGHGAPDPQTGESYLVPWDGDPQFLKSTALPLGRVYSDLAALPSAGAVVMLDACFSGAGGRSVLAPGARPLVNVQTTDSVPDKISVLSASGAREIAGGLDLRRHGLFTYFLLRGLSGEAADSAGHESLQDLGGYVRDRVRDAARRENRDQTPRLLGDARVRLY
jgi:hypothetical protein